MIDQQNYKQFISEQGGIETDIATGWGYKINPNQYVPRVEKAPCRPKVANFQPMKRVLDIPISKKIQQIDEELLMLQNEKKLARLTEQAKASLETVGSQVSRECAAVTMMHQRIQQYNFIVDHRHIIEKNTERARKILGIKKTKLQLLNEEIQALKDKIPGSSFAEVIQINQSIAKHYRAYEKQMLQSKQNTEGSMSLRLNSLQKSITKTSAAVTYGNSLINSSKLSPGPKTENKSRNESKAMSIKRSEKLVEIKDLMIMQELKQSSQGQSSYFDESVQEVNELKMMFPHSVLLDLGQMKMKRKVSEYVPRHRLYTVAEKPSAMEEKKQRMSTTVNESFVSKAVMDKGKILDKQLRQNEDVIDVWRQRIDQNKQKNEATYLRFLPKAKTFKKSLKNTHVAMATEEDILAKQKMEKAKKILAFRMMQVKTEMNEKQKMLATILRKKQSKYKRVPGTQLIQPNDPHQTAQKILGIANHFQGNARATVYSTKVQKEKKRVSTQAEGPEWLIMDQGSQQLYWSMCKNQKLNIRLKHKKN